LGLIRAPHDGQFQKNRQASVGMISALGSPQPGQTRTLSRTALTALRSPES
jgi:hypothetical protein